ncbi:ferritin family protein [Desulfosporosinus sp. PR]|uniref:ferritin family protein n=1 Tax=Candidatus Desulfosporosinus nitrosoreducens TaxID=3401928 RepID=UPI0027F2C2C8|nr:ferritin family protein [Desulfosporosinus sp. PR]MDQ7096442.1 ferritin family protein [Desulfosporosinus sp. PR]
MSWSIVNFTGEEIIKLALEMERTGKVFYEKAASYAGDVQLKEILSYLSKEEEKHIRDFQKLGEKLANEFVPNETYAGEYGDYLKSIINNHIFNVNTVEDLVKGIKTDRDILQFALSFEKDSIMIFQEFENFVNKAGKDVINELIDEEKGHIKKINSLFQII